MAVTVEIIIGIQTFEVYCISLRKKKLIVSLVFRGLAACL